jgi:ISXO2-like transposase domain
LYADEASAWNDLHTRYTLHRVNHEEANSLGGEHDINTNAAESFFSRMRRGETGHHHHVAGPYLIRFAQESAWREDHREYSNGSQVDRVVALAMTTSRVLFSAVLTADYPDKSLISYANTLSCTDRN